MKEILADLDRWRSAGRGFVVARVVDIEGSGPRLPGASMAVSEDGEVAGSVSGGCVEGAVVAEALELLASGQRRLVTFGYSDDEAFAVGLTCGGTVHLFLEPFGQGANDPGESIFLRWRESVLGQRPVAIATVIEGPAVGAKVLVGEGIDPVGSLGDVDLDRVVIRDTIGELAGGRTGVRHYGPHGEAREDAISVFVESFAPPPQMLVFGAVDFTGALVRVAKVLGYRVTVCDARVVFATHRRFPLADEVEVDWPHRLLERVGSRLGQRDAICVLTHDHKFDIPAIIAALGTDVGYLGAMGSRRTNAERLERLAEAGADMEAVAARLHAPIGLDLGGRTPEETAIAICAEIIAARTGRPAASLSGTEGPIH
jgi:xanthine dehydrogenase accessory factor